MPSALREGMRADEVFLAGQVVHAERGAQQFVDAVADAGVPLE